MVNSISTRPPPDPFFSLSPDMLCVVGGDGYFQRLNPRWHEVLGLSQEELLSRPLLDFVHPDDRAATVLTLPEFENRFACSDGTYRWLAWKIAAIRGGEGGIEAEFYCVVHDVTVRKIAERRLRTQFAVTRMLAGASTIVEAARGLLQAVGDGEGWPVGCLWRLDKPTHELRCEEFWHDPKQRASEFEKISRRTWFPAGEGLPGRVLSTGEPLFVPDVTKDERFPRAFWAVKDGLRSAYGFPIMAGAAVLGVIEFLGPRVREPDPLLREMLVSVGTQIGQFIKREEAEDTLKTCERRLHSVISHAPVVLLTVDGKGRFTLSEGRGLAALGRSPGQVVGRSVFEVYRDVPMLAEHVRRALNGDAFTDSVDLPFHKLRYETRYTPVRGPSGDVVEVIAVAVEVAERAAAEPPLPPKSSTAKDVAEQAEVAGAASSTPKSPRSRGRIMVIDDEPVLANALGRTLETDFDVTVLSNGQEALERLKEDQPFDVILCDLLMPGLTGMDLYEALSQSSPRLAERMIFMTGGTFTARARDFLAAVPNPALDKPFDLSMLHALLKARTMTM